MSEVKTIDARSPRYTIEQYGLYRRVDLENPTGLIVFMRSQTKTERLFKCIITTQPSIDDTTISRTLQSIQSTQETGCEACIVYPKIASLTPKAEEFVNKIRGLGTPVTSHSVNFKTTKKVMFDLYSTALECAT